MNSTIKNTLIFAIGAAIGSVVTWKLIKNKYEQIAMEEIADVKANYSKKEPVNTKPVEEKTEGSTLTEKIRIIQDTTSPSEPDIVEYAKKLKSNNYVNYSDMSHAETEESVTPKEKPYAIPPEDFGEYEEYDTISLFHYSDGVLADRDDDRIVNVDDVVGSDYVSHFGEYEDDSVHIRNDRLKCDFEILRSLKSYSEVLEGNPFKPE